MDIILKPHQYGKRLGQYLIMAYSLNELAKQGKLKDDLVKPQISLINKLYEFKVDFKTALIKEEFDINVKKLKKEAEEDARKEVEDYLPSIFNQVLVTSCSILDTYLVDCLSRILDKKPDLLKGLAGKEDITIVEIIDARDYAQIFNEIKAKTLARFDYKSINEKVSFLTQKLKIDIEKLALFPNHIQNVQKDFPLGIRILTDAYEKRNAIVHKDMQIIKTFDELAYLTQYMQIFMLELAFSIYDKFGITSDFMETVNRKT